MPTVSKLVVRLWSAFLALVFLAVSILGIIAIVLVKQFQGIGVGLLVFGIIGLAVAIAGLAGAGFEKGADEDSSSKIKGGLLVIFFAIMLILHILFMIFGVALICVSASLKMIVSMSPHDFTRIYDSLPKSFRKTPDIAIEKIQNFAIGLGVVMIIISVIILITCVASAVQMGKVLFTRFFMVSFSIVEILIGLSLAIFLLIINGAHTNVFFGKQIGKNVIIPIIIFGFVLALIGGVGFVATCVGHKYKVISVIFNVGNVILLIAFLVLFILCIVFHVMIIGWSTKICVNEEDGGPCSVSVNNTNTNRFGEDPNGWTYNTKDLQKDVETMLRGFTTILLFVCLYLVLFLAFVVVSTCINCFRKQEEVDDESSKPFINYY